MVLIQNLGWFCFLDAYGYKFGTSNYMVQKLPKFQKNLLYILVFLL